MTYREEFIHFMVRSGVLTFGDFTTKSGRKTPYFVNTGNYKTGAQAARLGDYYAACVQERLPDGVDALFGPAYKGIPLVVSAASALYRNYGRDLPYCFNRKEAKDHGEGGDMVGYKPQDGDRVAIIEDVVTAGTAWGSRAKEAAASSASSPTGRKATPPCSTMSSSPSRSARNSTAPGTGRSATSYPRMAEPPVHWP